MIKKEIIIDIISSYLNELGSDIYLVDTIINSGNRIVVELARKSGISIDDCAKLTRHIESILDRDVEDYELEVGSCGLTSPFKILRQYQEAIGEDIEVLVKGGIKLKGTLREVKDDSITLEIEKKVKSDKKKKKELVKEEEHLSIDMILQAKRIIKF